MSTSNNNENKERKIQKEIEVGILKAIADITNETDWPKNVDANDVQIIITQLARSAAHLRDNSCIKSRANQVKENFNTNK